MKDININELRNMLIELYREYYIIKKRVDLLKSKATSIHDKYENAIELMPDDVAQGLNCISDIMIYGDNMAKRIFTDKTTNAVLETMEKHEG